MRSLYVRVIELQWSERKRPETITNYEIDNLITHFIRIPHLNQSK